MLEHRRQKYLALPEYLDAVEFWAVSRQIVQAQPLLGPAASMLFHQIDFVDPSIGEQDNTWHRVWLVSDLITKSDDIIARDRAPLGRPDQLAFVAQCPTHVDLPPVRQWLDRSCLSDQATAT